MTDLRRKNATTDAYRIEHLLAKKFGPTQYAFMPQLRNSTGYSSSRVRTADAVAFSLWPSRGIYLHGFEIKVSRGDWLTEMKDPEKAEEIARFCRYWSLVVAEGIVDPLEVPLGWGLITATSKALTVVRQAPERQAEPITMQIAAAMFRNVADSIVQFKDQYVHVDDLEDRVTAEVEKQIDKRRDVAEFAQKDLKDLRERVKAFEAASGVTLDGYTSSERIGTAVQLVLERGPKQVIDRMHASIGYALKELSGLEERVVQIKAEVSVT